MRFGVELILTATILLSGAVGWSANWTDRGEYDLVLKIRSEPLPKKRTLLLDEWKQKYPNTEFRQMRRELYLGAFESLGDTAHMWTTAAEMLKEEPGNFVGLYWVTLLAPVVRDGPAGLETQAAAAARRLAMAVPFYFSAEKRPSWMKAEEWTKQKAATELLAHRTLGWATWQQRDYAAAEQEFTTYLQKKPSDAEVSSWLGIILALQNEPAKRVTGMWHLARAASKRDDGALSETQRRQIDAILERAYASYHGSSEGLDKLRETAVNVPFPPDGFAIESAQVIAARRAEEELNRTNPELAAWLHLRKRLEAADAETYFTSSLRNSPLPKLKGTLIRFSPAKRPTELILGVGEATSEEVVVKLSTRMPNEAEPGTVLTFEAVAAGFSPIPFQLTVVTDPNKIDGWPAPPSRPGR
jgi:hypothetical protein